MIDRGVDGRFVEKIAVYQRHIELLGMVANQSGPVDKFVEIVLDIVPSVMNSLCSALLEGVGYSFAARSFVFQEGVEFDGGAKTL